MDIYRTTIWHSRYNLNYRLRTKFRRKFATLKKKIPSLTPVTVNDNILATNWWAKAWNTNLKIYTKNNMHLEKGKLHFKCEALADLKISSNYIEAIVIGSKSAPYDVTITIKPIPETKWLKFQKMYSGDLESFEKILDNHFPKDMSDIFSNKASGLFPAVKEITFNCTCSAHTKICKHIAVALYGLGSMIDQKPQLLFQLRGVNLLEFISNSIHKERKDILKRINNKNLKILKDVNLSELFDINIKQK